MSEENRNTIKAFAVLIFAIGFVLLTFVSCTLLQNDQDNSAMTHMVEHGASPLAARCAIKGNACELSIKETR